MYAINDHARDRFAERFPGHDIETELSGAMPFGAQLTGSTLLLSECEAVFVVKDDQTVITTLTKRQAIANIQAFIKSPRKSGRSKPTNHHRGNYTRRSGLKPQARRTVKQQRSSEEDEQHGSEF